MRTVILIAGLVIADAIRLNALNKPSDYSTDIYVFLGIVILVSIVMDLSEFIKKMVKK